MKVAVKLSPDSELILHEFLFSYDAFNNIIVYDILIFCSSDPIVVLHQGKELACCTFIKKKDGRKLTKPLSPSAYIDMY